MPRQRKRGTLPRVARPAQVSEGVPISQPGMPIRPETEYWRELPVTDLPRGYWRQICPGCAQEVDLKSRPFTGIPRPGDACFCLLCGMLLTYNRALKLQRLTRQEWETVDPKQRAELAEYHKQLQLTASTGKNPWYEE